MSVFDHQTTAGAPAPAAPAPAPQGWQHCHGVRVYWEDTDAGGIVFYGNYLRFMERARTEWLRALGFEQEAMRRQGQGMFVVAQTQLRYLSPARLDDWLHVTVALTETGRASVNFVQEIWCGQRLLCAGEVRVGWVEPKASAAGAEFRPARIPAQVLARLPAAIVPPSAP